MSFNCSSWSNNVPSLFVQSDNFYPQQRHDLNHYHNNDPNYYYDNQRQYTHQPYNRSQYHYQQNNQFSYCHQQNIQQQYAQQQRQCILSQQYPQQQPYIASEQYPRQQQYNVCTRYSQPQHQYIPLPSSQFKQHPQQQIQSITVLPSIVTVTQMSQQPQQHLHRSVQQHQHQFHQENDQSNTTMMSYHPTNCPQLKTNCISCLSGSSTNDNQSINKGI